MKFSPPPEIESVFLQAPDLLAFEGTATRAAEVLREMITEGRLMPGVRLPIKLISDALGISGNTLREAFQLLAHERLVVQHLNRGIFVRELTGEDLTDIYRVRRLLECGALRAVKHVPDASLKSLRKAQAAGRDAASAGAWRDVATANLNFHRILVGLAQSKRADEMMSRTMAELRLFFAVTKDNERFYAPFLERQEGIITLLEKNDLRAAERTLSAYLTAGERILLDAYHEIHV